MFFNEINILKIINLYFGEIMTSLSKRNLERLKRSLDVKEIELSCPVKVFAEQLIKGGRKYSEKVLKFEADIFKALADPTRIKILRLLSEREEMCVCEIMIAIEQKQPITSHHLIVLKNAGLVSTREIGRWKFYRICCKKVTNFLEVVDEFIKDFMKLKIKRREALLKV